MLKKILQYWCRQVSQKQLKKSFIIGPMSHYFPALYKFDSVVLLRLDRCDLRGLEDANLEHLSTLKRVKILKILESLTAVERYRMLWQLLLTVESCDSFYELWQLLSDVRSGGFNKLWNLRQTSSWFGLPTDRQGKTIIGPGTNKRFKFHHQTKQVSEDFSGGWLNCVLDFSDTYMQVRKKQFCHRYAGGICKVCFGRRNWTKKAKSLEPH